MDFWEKINPKIYILNVEKNDSSFIAEKAIGKMQADVAFAKQEYELDIINEKNVEEGIRKFLKKNPSDI